MPNLIPVNSQVPVAVTLMDPVTGAMLSIPLPIQEVKPYGANATTISVSGTSTVDAGPGGLFYGVTVLNPGTLWTAIAYDINGTSTKQLSSLVSLAVGLAYAAGPPGLGVRYNGALVVVTAGTLAGSLNALWD